MTEAEWLACADPTQMLEFLRGTASGRKIRLFAVGCCLRIWDLLTVDHFRKAVRAAELFADGMIALEALADARSAAIAVFVGLASGDDLAPSASISATGIPGPKKTPENLFIDYFADPWWEDEFDKGDAHAPALVTARNAVRAAAFKTGEDRTSDGPAKTAEEQKQADLLRDIFGNPFRAFSTPTAWLAWNDGTIRKMAQVIYDDRAFDRLPLLADALEDAGCADVAILSHCREPGEHVRGCWVVDLLLDRK